MSTYDATRRHIYNPAQLKALLDEKHGCYTFRWDQLNAILSCFPANPFEVINETLAKLEKRLATLEERP